jgi:mRNA interferase YafQ
MDGPIQARLQARDQRQKGRHRATLDEVLFPVVEQIANDEQLAPKFRDHALTGDWSAHRDCHIKPDLVLIYHLPDEVTLRLVRLGSDSELRI